MVGAIDGDVVMHERPVGRGYVVLDETPAFPWPATPRAGSEVRAHEFHYASLENLPADTRFAYRVRRGHGIDGERDGIVTKNVLASFAHRRSTERDHWAARFVAFVRASGYRQRRAAQRRPGPAAAPASASPVGQDERSPRSTSLNLPGR